MKKLCHTLLTAIDALCVCLLVMIFLSITIQIFCRFTAVSLTWTEEFARVCFVCMSYLAAPLCLAEGAHIAVDMLTNLLPKSIRRLADALVHAAVCFFSVIFIKSMVINLSTNIGVTTITMTWLKMNWIYSIEIATFALAFAISAIQLFLTLLGRSSTMELLEKNTSTLTEEDLGL